jgi:hypothetical protein
VGSNHTSRIRPRAGRRGRRLRLSLQRRWIGDLMAAASATPVAGGERVLRVSAAAGVRRSMADPPGWTAVILKAYALVATRRPELRQMYLPVPWPHIYEHPCSVATVVVEREWCGEPGVFLDQIVAPETKPLMEIDRMIRGLRRNPIESVGGYRRLIRLSRLPRLLRRSIWWCGLRCSGYVHARYFGTFALNALTLPRSMLLQSATPITVALTHLPLDASDRIRLFGVFDHRVLDGMRLLRAVGEVEAAINDEIVTELRSLAEAPQTRADAADL